MQTPLIVTAGIGGGDNFDGREGDMSQINVDPIDGSFWAINEFTDASSSWGQAIANFTVVTPLTVTTSNGVLSYDALQPPIVIDPGIVVVDGANPPITGATVKITGNYANPEDVLALPAPVGNITSLGFNAATGTLTLTGND